jgi:hypothetical protein
LAIGILDLKSLPGQNPSHSNIPPEIWEYRIGGYQEKIDHLYPQVEENLLNTQAPPSDYR